MHRLTIILKMGERLESMSLENAEELAWTIWREQVDIENLMLFAGPADANAVCEKVARMRPECNCHRCVCCLAQVVLARVN